MADIEILSIHPPATSAGRCRAEVDLRVDAFVYRRVRLVVDRNAETFLGWPARKDDLGRWIASVEVLDRDLAHDILTLVTGAVDAVRLDRVMS